MKSRLLSSIITVFAFLFVLISCTDKPTVVGKWSPVNVDQKYREMNHSSEEDLKNMYQNEKAEFTKDGKFIAPSKEDTAHGTFVYDDAQKKFSITIDHEEKAMSFTVQFSGKDQMSLTNDNGTIIFKRY